MGQLEGLLKGLLDNISWGDLRTSLGDARSVPDAFLSLVGSDDEDGAEECYWRLDNVVVVQGRAYQSAVALVEPIVVAVCDRRLSAPARYWLVELLAEIGLAGGHEDEADPEKIASNVAATLQRNLLPLCSLAIDEDPRVRRAALHVLFRVAGEDSVSRRVRQALAEDEDPDVRAILAETKVEKDYHMTALDLQPAMRSLEALWSFPKGPLALLRRGEISVEAADHVIAVLESIELSPNERELDRLMVALLWNLPLFVEYQKERVLERGGDEETYHRLRGRVFGEVERILGLGHVDHDVDKWFSQEI